VHFDIGSLVKRNPTLADEIDIYPHELEEVGIVISFEQDDISYDVVYVIVLWGEDICREIYKDLISVP